MEEVVAGQFMARLIQQSLKRNAILGETAL